MCRVNTYQQGQLVEVGVTFTEADGTTKIDPDEVYLLVRTPNGALSTYEYGVDAIVVRSGVGDYFGRIDANEPSVPDSENPDDNWSYEWKSTGDGQAAKTGFFGVSGSIAPTTYESPILVDDDHSWEFHSPSQTTSPNYIVESLGFDGLVRMDFTEPLPAAAFIATVGATTIAPITGAPTLGTAFEDPDGDNRAVMIPVDATGVLVIAGTYTVTQSVVTDDGQTFPRKGKLVLQ
jgi:hypothetical protein